ncbi:MAG: aminomethyltransferase family protein [Chloroflexota bacterium]|nr:aminomethyltransferase family protein [Chloroflexota bacterium]
MLGRDQQLGARFVERDGVTLARDYGDVRGEHAALSDAGLIDLAHFGVLRVEGRDRVAWLHKLVTTNVEALEEGGGAYALLLDAKGHVAADFVVLRLADALLLYTSTGAKRKLFADLRRAIFREKVTLTDQSEAFAVLSLQGAMAQETLGQALGTYFSQGEFCFSAAKFFDSELLIVNSPRAEYGGLDLIVARRHAEMLWGMLAAKGARPVGIDALNIARVEAGIAWYGDDFDETMLAPEARLDRFIAENKGCYTGQEVIARIKNRGHVNRWLVQIQVEGGVAPARGDLIFADDKESGWITSAVWSFANGAPLALGYLRREMAQDGTRVQIARGEMRLDATVGMR